jgi:flagella basal body P-ring formation protein FlgA
MNSIDKASYITRFALTVGFAAMIAILWGVAPAAADGVGATPLSLRNHVTIDGGSVQLRDIFDGFENPHAGVSGDTVIAYAPQPGRRAVFDANWLARVAQRHRLDWRPTTRLDRVIVERASTVIDAEDIVSALRDEITARGHGQNIDLELSNRNLLVHIDAGLPPTIEVVHIDTEARRGKFSAIVAIPAGDPQARRITVVGQFFSVVEVPVPARALRPGSAIRQSDIKWQRVRANRIGNDVVTDPNEFVGREAKRPLSANTMVRRSELREPVAVSKGMLVTMIFRTPSMVLTATGRALEAGATDDFISVRNSQTGATVDARILGPNRVEVAALRLLASSEGNVQ